MGLSADQLGAALRAVEADHPAVAATLAKAGVPLPRIRERGFASLARTIVGQQVSVSAAASMWNRLDTAAGGAGNPARILALTDQEMRAAAMSRQKASYLRSLAEEVSSGRLDLERLPEDDEAAIEALTRVKGIGRWSAEIYLLFAEGRTDIWPAGDLAVQVEVGRILDLPERPKEAEVRALAEAWRPHRGAMAILCWHSYEAGSGKTPL